MRVQGSGEEGAAATRLLRFPWSTADPSRLSGGGQRESGSTTLGEGMDLHGVVLMKERSGTRNLHEDTEQNQQRTKAHWAKSERNQT